MSSTLAYGLQVYLFIGGSRGAEKLDLLSRVLCRFREFTHGNNFIFLKVPCQLFDSIYCPRDGQCVPLESASAQG